MQDATPYASHQDQDWPLTRAQLADRYQVHRSAVTRAMALAQQDPDLESPPEPVNKGETTPRYRPSEFDPWWERRRRPGRPDETPDKETAMTLNLQQRVLGPADNLPAEIDGFPVYRSGQARQTWEPHIVVGVADVTPGRWYGYQWEMTFAAYRRYPGGRHGGQEPERPTAAAEWWELDWWSWGQAHRESLTVNLRQPAGQRVAQEDALAALHRCAAALLAEPAPPLPWAAYGPKHQYGHWASEEEAVDWLAGHMDRLAGDRNLGADRQAQAAVNAELLRGGVRLVQISGKVYGVRRV